MNYYFIIKLKPGEPLPSPEDLKYKILIKNRKDFASILVTKLKN